MHDVVSFTKGREVITGTLNKLQIPEFLQHHQTSPFYPLRFTLLRSTSNCSAHLPSLLQNTPSGGPDGPGGEGLVQVIG